MTPAVTQRGALLARELVVPAIMLAGAGLYWTDASNLSAEAQAFPLALTALLLLLLTAIVGRAVHQWHQGERPREQADEDHPADVMRFAELKRWTIVLLPVALILVWQHTGAAVAIFLYALLVLIMLGERRLLRLALIPACLAIGLTYLFKTVLYLRLPDAAWLPGTWL
ncbi:MAG: tripartite tricarboxylate transporter TctB family protein [Hyphomicrobiales bacterium]|nr:tripartite tricarboxylate transporter TctB family protein [Hyphomicrobiales bacterium]